MKILFIAGHEFLYNPQNGGQKCSLRNYELLKKIYGEENVILILFSNFQYDNLPLNVKVFKTQKNNFQMLINTIFLRNVCSYSEQKKLINYVESLEFDILFVDSSTIGITANKIRSNKKVITFFHNIEKNYAWNKVKHEGIKYMVAYFSYYLNERCAVNISNKIILLNKRDENQLLKIYNRGADFFWPITFEDTFCLNRINLSTNDKIVLLFVGSLFAPNYDGIKWFINNVMAELNNEKYILKVVGKGLEKKRDELQRKNVEVIGTVNDLSPYYYEADAVVIPIFYGDGMKVKTAEAMMYGKKIIASDEALEGYEVENITEIIRCNLKKEYLDAIKSMKTGEKYCEDVRKLFLEKYCVESQIKQCKKEIDSLI